MTLESADIYDRLIKCVVVGDSSVGKSNLLYRFCEDRFTPSFIATVGIDFKIKTITVAGERCKLQIWDTAGQERFRSITSAYYRGAHAVVIVFDLTKTETFKNVAYWIEQAESLRASNSIPCILVGNKSDMENTRVISESKDVIPLAEAHAFPYIETSAKTGANVNKLFTIIVERVMDAEKFQPTHEPIHSVAKPNTNTCC